MEFQVDMTGEPVFEYALNPDNACGGAATASVFIQRLGNTGHGEFDRWFSKSSIILANGTGKLSIELSPINGFRSTVGMGMTRPPLRGGRPFSPMLGAWASYSEAAALP